MTTSDQLQALIVTALTGATAAGANVYAPRDWPVQAGELPIILVQSPSERKESWGRVPASFTVTSTFRVMARVASVAGAGDTGAVAVLAVLGVLQRQIEVAVINDYALTLLIQQIASVEVKNDVSADGEKHIGELTMDFALEYVQGPQDFAPPATSPLEEVMVYADLVNVFDPHGTYANPPFPATVEPAPRAEGPDGRVEAGALITLPQ